MLFGRNINRYYRKHFPILLLGLITLIAVDVVQLEIPKLYGMVINGINEGQVLLNGSIHVFNMDFLLDKICLPLIYIIMTMVVGRFLWRICFFGTGFKIETDIRRRMFDHAKNLSQQYYQVNKVGNLMSLFTNDLDTVQECFGSGILMFIDAISLSIMAISKMLRMNLLLTVLCLIPMGCLLAAALIIGRYMTIKWKARQEAFSKLSDFAQESFSGIAVIKAFVKEGKELSRFTKLNRKNEVINVDYVKLSAKFNAAINLFIGTVVCIILGYGGYLVYGGTFNVGQLLEFQSYFNSIIWPVMAVSQLIEMHSKGKASLKRIDDLLDAKQDVQDRENVEEIQAVQGRITCKNLTFSYPGTQLPVLDNISFEIEPGEQIGIIGRTGAGKTTLVDLFLRTYNVPDGSIFVDGHDVNCVSIESLRKAAAYVPQDNTLFSDTISNNIAFGVDDSSEEEICRVAGLAHVDSNIREFPLGYNTMLGERGVTISGGQKQRVSIARALLKDAPILILDDSVSAVDTATEKVILDNLRSSRKGKTTLLIAHRITTVENMDRIIFLDKGKLVDMGSHEELVERCEPYRNMVELQKLEEGKQHA